jgi:ectoine hydroxylase-related dioxygenase (phytanoyl-CoA dioxygenase family)
MDMPLRQRLGLRSALRRLRHASCALAPAAAAAPSRSPDDDPFAELRGSAVAPLQGAVDGPFSEVDLRFWAENGYVILHNAVPAENTQAVVDDIFEFLSMDPQDAESWYHFADVPEGESLPHNAGGMVEMYQTQSLWDNRQHPRIHAAFAQLWGTEDLWVSNDRASMKPPTRADKPEWDNDGFLHWDTDPRDGVVKFAVQGVLYLADTPEDGGGFQCIPGSVRRFRDWGGGLFPARGPRDPSTFAKGFDKKNWDDMKTIYSALEERRDEVRSIPGKRGDLLIWHSHLAHGNCRNSSDTPRLAQYVSVQYSINGKIQKQIMTCRNILYPEAQQMRMFIEYYTNVERSRYITMFPSPTAAAAAGGRYSRGGESSICCSCCTPDRLLSAAFASSRLSVERVSIMRLTFVWC